MILTIGYLASLFLALSILAKNEIKARIFNMVGCVFFIVYGLLIPAFPVIFANVGLLILNIFQLYKLNTKQEQFKLVEVNAENNLAAHFLTHYEQDISKYFPNFKWTLNPNVLSFIVLRNMELANIFVVELNKKGQAIVTMNYTIPKFRDYKVGKFIFNENKDFLGKLGVHEMVYTTPIEKSHLEFIKLMGFTEQTIDGVACYSKKLV